MNLDAESAVNLLIALGIVGGVRYLFVWGWKRWRRGRDVEQRQAQITAAQQIQDAALELVEPIRKELREARQEAKEARQEAVRLRREMDETLEDWLGWMRRAAAVLEAHHLPVEPLPLRRIQ